MDGYVSKIRKVSRCRPAVLNETILATRQEFFFTKVAPVQSITDIVLLDFWLILLAWMFISSYNNIYFFVKKFIFPNVYISLSTIFEYLYMFFGWERGHQLSTYATVGGWGSFQMQTTAYRGKGCHASCVRKHVHSLFMFWQHFCLIVPCNICRNLTLSLFKKDVFVKSGCFFPTNLISVVKKEDFFAQNYFCEPKLAKTFFILIK